MQQYTTFANLPMPDPVAQAHSKALVAEISHHIKKSGGKISFAEFMRLALYAPGLGYYSAGSQKFGKAGDFVTAPEISDLFGQCLARQCQQILTALPGGDILELGAGSGKLAADLLQALHEMNLLPSHYYILEISADLRVRQQIYLRQTCPFFINRIIWLDELPAEPLQGVIIANEVLDAMPVEQFKISKQGIQQCYITVQAEQFEYSWSEPQANLREASQVLSNKLPEPLAIGYQSEVNLTLPGWIKSIEKSLKSGVILLIDYGFPNREYYHPARHMGTLMCHFRHHAHDNPLILCGLQDITAHVDFTLIAENAVKLGMQVSGFTTQAFFLVACGLLTLINEKLTTTEQLTISQQIKKLTLPTEMGELFKVMALSKNINCSLLGFAQHNMLMRL